MEIQHNLTEKSPPKLIYIADSDIDVCRSLEMLLNVDGVSVSVFETGAALLSRALKTPPSCIIMESSMPDMDGLTIVDCLKYQSLEIPVILLFTTSVDLMGKDIPMAVKALKAGVWDFFEKPFMQQRLIDSVNRAIKQG